ncbi:TrbI/VirB10 family protein [Mesorhizobium sp. M7A.F.Ca.MR.245.00.0.0]|uniref:TrbI/VirB10 family protein n=1 Tax=Mesorhizobium sp. M7A.F.Ca.MR.245.00.0.0 TaxID=2496778 RepID=UPI000FCA1324|nr:TrbI/VirB10 family protein [Mesorhizobium sp. M7A.F.Ca.MR.245.00.0.0]RUV21075.1 TrbI/VirB10 family protein [Mesorhizobium sp. M7A.F.Ca.MR.245.00.0.0]RWO39587.1 MAG: TrbI/VirB10 family protein [Mesorhizobium sp.]
MSDKMGPGKEEGPGPANDAWPEAPVEDDARPLTGEPIAAMRLRAEPPRVTRLSRKALTGLGLAASLAVGSALLYALQNRQQGQGQELYSTDNRSTPDGLAGLPKDYAGVPKLGPPLPGDLGRPILNAQNGGPTPSTSPVGPDPEQQRREQELEAARTARLFASTQTRPASDATLARATTETMPRPDLASLGLAPQPATPSAQDRQLAFLDQPPDKRTVSSDRIAAPASKNVLQAGAVIAAALITGIRSDLPGQITAQVTENVYDSPTGHILLIPQGTRLVGQYDNGVGFGQRRVLLVWTRLIFPDGRSIVLEREPGADAEGYAGLEDGVDYHWGELFKAAALSTVLSIGAQAGSSGQESDIVRALRQGASDSISQAGQQIVQRQLNIAPTLTIRPGFPVRVIVTHDLVLEPYGG